jgi:hypothetical protein
MGLLAHLSHNEQAGGKEVAESPDLEKMKM